MRTVLEWLGRAGTVVRRVIGAPDYETYVTHMHARHPHCATLTREEFVIAQLEAKYKRPGSRCC